MNFLGSKAYAYPHFISLGYNSCITCHYNPFGNGPINDYGRSVSGTAIASRDFYDENKPEELIASETAFFMKEALNKHIKPFIGYRGMFYKSNLGQEGSKVEFINMQFDANLVVKFGEKDQFIASGTFGYAPIPRALQNTPTGDAMKEYRTREHYIGYRPKPNWGIYFGLMDKTYGIRVAEHNSFSRISTQLTQDDQAHGAILHYSGPTFEGGLNAFVGNLATKADVRTKGFAGTFEQTVFEKNRIGASFLSQKDDYLKTMATAIHSRSQITYGTSVMVELGRVDKKPVNGTLTRKEYYALLQNHIKTHRGLYFLNSVEYFKSSLDKNYRVRFGPGLQYYPFSKLELRADVYNTRNFNQEANSRDRWDLLMQIHAWF
ncbi:MAG: hypothetical protein H7281_02005 [Bacteriovorax sp.]|nr:hypothetical protein [Bacteriovorax sp.]